MGWISIHERLPNMNDDGEYILCRGTNPTTKVCLGLLPPTWEDVVYIEDLVYDTICGPYIVMESVTHWLDQPSEEATK